MKKNIFSILCLIMVVFIQVGCGDFIDSYFKDTNNPSEILLNHTTLTLTIGTEATLLAEVTPIKAKDRSITWSSSNPEVVTVTNTGSLFGVSLGTSTITAKTSNDLTATCVVTVENIDESSMYKVIQPTNNSYIISQTQNPDFLQTEILKSDGQKYVTYSYTAPLDGYYLITSSNVVYCNIYDSYNNVIFGFTKSLMYSFGTKNYLGTSNGFTLTEGMNYTIVFIKSEYNGPYEFNIYAPNEIVDISLYTDISDMMIFQGQCNVYTYTAPRTGYYRFETSTPVYCNIYDSYDNVIFGLSKGLMYKGNSNNDMRTSKGFNFKERITYTIVLIKQVYSGEFTLHIGLPNNPVDITQYSTIYDEIRFDGQQNIYTFTANVSGEYTFSTSILLDCGLVDNLGNVVFPLYANGSSFNKTTPISVNLIAGRTYTLTLQSKGVNKQYTFQIDKPKD